MAHFVPIPPDREYWVPKLKELSLFDPNATAAINVWGLPPNSTIRAGSTDPNAFNGRFTAVPYANPKPDLTSFYLRGLVAGDYIAVFTGDTQMTDWLEIKFVKGDKHARERKGGTLPRSRHQPNLILDAHGSEQRHPPVTEADWTREVELAIVKIRSNAVGRLILGSIIKDIRVMPFIPTEENANSTVSFTPQTWRGRTEPGAMADEVLLHELCHVLENNFDGYLDELDDPFEWDASDFFTITATNLYASVNGRPLRKDHHGFTAIPSPYDNAGTFKSAEASNLGSVKTRMPAVHRALGAIAAGWNPFA